MKKIRLLFVLPLVLMMLSFQSDAPEWGRIQRAITQGNANGLSAWFAPTVTLALPSHRGSFSTAQTRSMMQEFFKANPPKSFEVQSSGQTGQSGRFYLGTYTSSQNQRFAVYVLLQPISGQQRITRLTFEPN